MRELSSQDFQTPDIKEKTLLSAAQDGNVDAQVALGLMCERGHGVKKDETEATKWYRAAAEQKHADAQFNLGWMYAHGRGVARDEAEAVKWFRAAAEQKHADAQSNLGTMYVQGKGVARDEAEATKWFRAAAEQKHADAQSNLGTMYVQGKGVARDEAEAVKWFRAAAEQKHAGAQFNLGVMYEHGRGVARDEAEAVKWYRAAAEQKHAKAQFSLGVMYAHDRGVAGDEAEAVKWYRAAAEQKHAKAQFNLGMMYAQGKGVARDEAEAVKWFRAAAEQKHADAQFNLGVMCEKGLGLKKDEVEAVKWFRAAAEQNHVNAQFSLGWIHEKGLGVEKEEDAAAYWYQKAAEQGHLQAQNNLLLLTLAGHFSCENSEKLKWPQLMKVAQVFSLGSGTYGRVYAVTLAGKSYVLKVPQQTSESGCREEFAVYADIKDHPNFLTLLIPPPEFTVFTKTVLFFPFAKAINLNVFAAKLHSIEALIHFKILQWVLAQLVVALEALHEKGWTHRDLKENNVLVEEGARVKLIDFGVSTRETTTDCQAMLVYFAPEAPDPRQVKNKLDEWSFAIMTTFLFFSSARGAFQSDRLASRETIMNEIEKDPSPDNPFSSEMLTAAKNLIGYFLITDPQTRPSIHRAKECAFFRDINWESIEPPHAQITREIVQKNYGCR